MLKTGLLGLAVLWLAACGGIGGATSAISADAPTVRANGDAPLMFGQVMMGAEVLSPDIQPADFEPVSISSSCKMPRASRRAKVAYISLSGANTKGFVQHVHLNEGGRFQNSALRVPKGAATNFEGRMMVSEFNKFQASNQLESTSRVDIVITETDAPVFLFVTNYNSVLWNIQLAPGAELDGIVVNSYEGGVVANGVSAARTGFRIFGENSDKRCYVKTYADIVSPEERAASAKEINPNIDLSRHKDEWESSFRAQKKFFSSGLKKLTGKTPDWIISGAKGVPVDTLRVVVIGPAPSEPIAFQPINRLQIPETIDAFWGSRRDGFKFFGIDVSG